MAMRANSDPRRVYTRAGMPLVCYGGIYFGPSKGESKINAEKEVRIDVLPNDHGKKKIQVKQKVGKNTVTETWPEQKIEFGTRTAAAAPAKKPAKKKAASKKRAVAAAAEATA